MGDDPEGGAWNYDKENRRSPKTGMDYPKPPRSEPDELTQDVIAMVEAEFPARFGAISGFDWGVSRDDTFDHFVAHWLEKFGTYQDAMVGDELFLFHSLTGLYLNSGLLRPLKSYGVVAKTYADGGAPLNVVEGFIRQIIGWREYVHGIYFLKMPNYRNKNFFGNHRTLPNFYWTGETDMNCLKQSIDQTIEHAYAHHIQRLMIMGDFALLTGIDPLRMH